MHTPSHLGEYIAHLRKRREWSQAELARRAGVNRSYINRIESGERPAESVSREILERIAAALNEPPQNLLALLRQGEVASPPPAFALLPTAIAFVSQGTANRRGGGLVVKYELRESSDVRRLVPQGIQVETDDMGPEIEPGDFVLYEDVLPANGETIVAAIDDGEGVVIRRYFRRENLIELQPDDGSEPLELPPDRVRLLGVVREIFSRKRPSTRPDADERHRLTG